LLIEYYIEYEDQINKIVIIEVERLSEEIEVVHKNGATHQQGKKTQHALLNLIKKHALIKGLALGAPAFPLQSAAGKIDGSGFPEQLHVYTAYK
jgi:hypothetical protein